MFLNRLDFQVHSEMAAKSISTPDLKRAIQISNALLILEHFRNSEGYQDFENLTGISRTTARKYVRLAHDFLRGNPK